MKTSHLAGILLFAAPTWASYSYYLTDSLTSIDPVRWGAVGTLAPGSSGLAVTDPAGGSLISRLPIPDGTAEAEVRITLRLAASGGTYTEFLQATPDARTGGAGGGTYIAFEMQNPQFDSQGHCTANFLVLQSVAGVTTLLSAFQHGCRDGMTMRLAVHGGIALVWPDQPNPTELPVPILSVGEPGIGAHGMPSGNAISQVQLGLIDRIAPGAVDATKIKFTAFRNHVYVKWPAVTDDPNGSGLASYWIARDDFYFMRTTATVFEDMTVNPSESHTYAIAAVDEHYNFSTPASVTVSTPVPKAGSLPPNFPKPPQLPPAPQSAGAITRDRRRSPAPLQVTAGTPPADSGNGMDPRRTGVRALGSYWGAAGEQIDTTSGNLNVSLPLFKVLSRGGWGVTFNLSYNSQMWLQDSSGVTWLLGPGSGLASQGYDVGYGLGWTLQAGSIVPVWTSTSTIDHYLYVDATGAEYSLSSNTAGVWTGREGVYVTYDSNANRLYFNDGSFWVMGSQSSGGEADSGTLYPTLIEDSNGNQLS